MLVVLMLLNWLLFPSLLSRQVTEVGYDELVSMMDSGKVQTVSYDSQDHEIIFEAQNDKGQTAIYKTGIFPDDDLVNRLLSANVKFAAEIPTQASPLVSMLVSYAIPIVLIIVVGNWLQKKMMKNMGGNMMSFGKSGAKIYAEVTPHHLSLTEDDVPAHGTYARMNPPLRKEVDRQALIEALADGTIDMIATDHAPHTAEEKARDFAKAPSGITGLETAFSVCNTYLVQTGRLTPMQLLEKMSRNPAEIYGLTGRAVQVGNYARLVLLDWDSEKVYTEYKSKGINTPYTGMKLTGAPRAIVTGDKVTE